MGERRSIPLGIDLGLTRVRIACGEMDRDGEIRLRAIVSRNLPDPAGGSEQAAVVGTVIEEAWSELGTRERRCVLAVGPPAATLRYVRFPRMPWSERLRAARFEVERWPGWSDAREGATVRVHGADAHDRYAVGAIGSAVLEQRLAAVRAARLRPVAVDYESLALRRVFQAADAIVDVAAERTCVHVFEEGGPLCAASALAGAEVTRGIANELAIDLRSAERRKRILGCAGAGSAARDDVVAAIASLLEGLRGRSPISSVAITGNGARLPQFLEDLEAAAGVHAEMPVPRLLAGDAYPPDVVRTAAPDWALAVGLLSWSAA